MFPVLIGIFILVIVVGVVYFLVGQTRKGKPMSGKRTKDRETKIQEASKRLSSNPLDPHALFNLGEVYFEEETWDMALKAYETLSDLASRSKMQGINIFEVHYRCALSAFKLNFIDQAAKSFLLAKTINPKSFEVNYHLGALEFERKNYEKAIQSLIQARTVNPENPAVLRYMGHAFFRMKKPKEAMSFIRKAIDLAPDDKESLYTLAECYHEANQTDQALRIFSHLRADPVMGPSACLYSGKIHVESRKTELAIQDFEMGLKHTNVKPEILVELRYLLATSYLAQNELSKAIPVLKLIHSENPSYKDVGILIARYQELNTNKNLQIFLMAPSADFVALCRKVVLTYFARAKVKILNISVNKNEWADILTEVNAPKWSDLIMFRFIRTQGVVGELVVRDFHSHLKEVKAGKGICVTVGTFSDEAKRYIEARLVDLIEKEKLTAILNSVDAKTAALTNRR